MNTQPFRPLYAQLTPEERVQLVLAAVARRDMDEVARLRDGIRKVIASKVITYDLARQLPGAKEVATSVFTQAVVDAIHGAPR